MCIASGFGADIASADPELLFAETVGRYVVEADFAAAEQLEKLINAAGAQVHEIGRVSADPRLEVARLLENRSTKVDAQIFLDEMTKAWRGTLDW